MSKVATEAMIRAHEQELAMIEANMFRGEERRRELKAVLATLNVVRQLEQRATASQAGAPASQEPSPQDQEARPEG